MPERVIRPEAGTSVGSTAAKRAVARCFAALLAIAAPVYWRTDLCAQAGVYVV